MVPRTHKNNIRFLSMNSSRFMASSIVKRIYAGLSRILGINGSNTIKKEAPIQ